MEQFVWGESERMAAVRDEVQHAAAANAPILITGETGTGKNLVAHTIHTLSNRVHKPFIPVDIALVSTELLASELFGHEPGAFTDAHSRHHGVFERADGGTLFLDEIGDMPMELQNRLLRVIEEKQFFRLGGEKLIHSNARVISATNQNLKALIKKKRFRLELYYRLNTICIHLPPLRKRAEDIPLILEYFLRHETDHGSRAFWFSKAAIGFLQSYPWPGNLRQLANLVRYFSAMGRGEISLKQVQAVLSPAAPPLPKWHAAKARFERRLLQRAMATCNGNQHEMARQLGLPRSTLRDLLRKHGLLQKCPPK